MTNIIGLLVFDKQSASILTFTLVLAIVSTLILRISKLNKVSIIQGNPSLKTLWMHRLDLTKDFCKFLLFSCILTVLLLDSPLPPFFDQIYLWLGLFSITAFIIAKVSKAMLSSWPTLRRVNTRFCMEFISFMLPFVGVFITAYLIKEKVSGYTKNLILSSIFGLTLTILFCNLYKRGKAFPQAKLYNSHQKHQKLKSYLLKILFFLCLTNIFYNLIYGMGSIKNEEKKKIESKQNEKVETVASIEWNLQALLSNIWLIVSTGAATITFALQLKYGSFAKRAWYLKVKKEIDIGYIVSFVERGSRIQGIVKNVGTQAFLVECKDRTKRLIQKNDFFNYSLHIEYSPTLASLRSSPIALAPKAGETVDLNSIKTAIVNGFDCIKDLPRYPKVEVFIDRVFTFCPLGWKGLELTVVKWDPYHRDEWEDKVAAWNEEIVKFIKERFNHLLVLNEAKITNATTRLRGDAPEKGLLC